MSFKTKVVTGAVFFAATLLAAPPARAVMNGLGQDIFPVAATFYSSATVSYVNALNPGVTVSSGLIVGAGRVGIGTDSPLGMLHARSARDSEIALLLQANSVSQAANLMETRKSDGTLVTAVTNDGWFANIGETTGATAFAARIGADSVFRYALFAGGAMEWGNGGASSRDIYMGRIEGATPNLTVKTISNSAVGFQVKESGDSTVFAVDTNTQRVGVGTASPSVKLDVNGDAFRVRVSSTIISAGDPCNTGEIRWDSGFVYICVSLNSWKRATIAAW